MYAIVEINGQQFKVEQGKKLFVNHMKDVEEGKTVEFDKVLLVDNEGSVQVGAPTCTEPSLSTSSTLSNSTVLPASTSFMWLTKSFLPSSALNC